MFCWFFVGSFGYVRLSYCGTLLHCCGTLLMLRVRPVAAAAPIRTAAACRCYGAYNPAAARPIAARCRITARLLLLWRLSRYAWRSPVAVLWRACRALLREPVTAAAHTIDITTVRLIRAVRPVMAAMRNRAQQW
jgi:hypothetical protein